MMKTDNLTHAVRNSEHIKTIKHFCTQHNGRTYYKHSLDFRHFGFNLFTVVWHL